MQILVIKRNRAASHEKELQNVMLTAEKSASCVSGNALIAKPVSAAADRPPASGARIPQTPSGSFLSPVGSRNPVKIGG